MVIAHAHDNILFFTDRGRVFQLKAHQVPEVDRTAKGTPIINMINIEASETVTAVIGTASFTGNHYLAMATKFGEIKKVAIDEFSAVRSSGLIAMDLAEGDELGWVCNLNQGAELVLVTEHGQAARFHESTVPARRRTAGGVRSMRLVPGDRVCGMDVVVPRAQLLLVTAGGHAKRTQINQFSVTNRGVTGVIALKTTDKSGPMVAARVVTGNEEVMVISSMGTVLRTPVSSVSVQGRAAQGVAFMNLRAGDRIACVALLNSNGTDDDDHSAPTPGSGRGGRRAPKAAAPAPPATDTPTARPPGRPRRTQNPASRPPSSS